LPENEEIGMKKIILIISLIALHSAFVLSQTADEVLQKTAAKLASLKTIKYKYHQEYNYASEAYFRESAAESFLDLTPLDNQLNLKFQFNGEDVFIAYNGSESFVLAKKDKTIRVETKPEDRKIYSFTYLQFSPLMWRNALPQIIADRTMAKSLSETEINQVKYYEVEFALNKSFIDTGNGKILPLTTDRQIIYRLTIDKTSFLPVVIYRGNSVNQDFNKTTLTEIVENPAPPTENSWYYSTYLNEYKYAEPPKDNLIKAGDLAYELSLPMYETNKTVSLNDYKGQVVLLDFWIFHCGYCQSSVPKLNSLQEKFKDKNFNLLTVNVTDSEKLIRLFIEKTNSKFPILYQGEATAKKYGVVGFPTVVLIGKDGKVIYSGNFDQTKLEDLINQSL
jgi:thiol-disulfide isomerase/thioredoxin